MKITFRAADLTLALLAAPGLATPAFAKAHDQGRTDNPGRNVGTETVTNAQGLGEARGNRPSDKGPRDSNPAREKADKQGNSKKGDKK